tara:strand:- start:807 stop:911 length:105 start_codon:yes stop_codon:yes gene_type:complete
MENIGIKLLGVGLIAFIVYLAWGRIKMLLGIIKD